MGLRKLLLNHSIFSQKSSPSEKSLPTVPPPLGITNSPPPATSSFGWPYTAPPQISPAASNYGWPYASSSPAASPVPSPMDEWNGTSGEGDSYFTCKPALGVQTPGYLHTTHPLPSEERVDAWGLNYPHTAQPAPPTGSPAAWSTLSMPPSSPTPSAGSRVSSTSTLCDVPTLTCTSKKSSPVSPLRPALKRRGTSQDPEGPIKPRYRVSFRNPTVGIPVLMHPLFARSSSSHGSPPPSPPLPGPTSPWIASSRTPSPIPSPRGSPLPRSRSNSPLAPQAFARAIPQPVPRAPIAYDVSLPPSVQTVLDWCGDPIPRQSLMEPATEPPTRGTLVLDYQEGVDGLSMPWKVEVWASGNVRDSGGTPAIPSSKKNTTNASERKGPKFYINSSDEEDDESDSDEEEDPTPEPRHDAVVTNLDVLQALHASLNKSIRAFEWDALDIDSQKKVYAAYKARCAAGGRGRLEDGVKRIDWLQGRNVFAGVESLKVDSSEIEEDGALVGRIVFQEEEAVGPAVYD